MDYAAGQQAVLTLLYWTFSLKPLYVSKFPKVKYIFTDAIAKCSKGAVQLWQCFVKFVSNMCPTNKEES